MARKRVRVFMPVDENKREQVLRLLDRGLILQYEAADMVGVTRQRIHQWVQAAGCDPVRSRRRYLQGLLNAH